MLETSVEDFVSRFEADAAEGQLYPQPEGSPLMEFVSGGRTLYLFDRTGPYTAKPGAARVIVHGTFARFAKLPSVPEPLTKLAAVGISGMEGVGQITRLASRFTVVVQARLPLVLSSFTPLPELEAGEWLSFETQPPLHGFLAH
ncbi:hypothetical protein EHF33_09725 [Deinococcus psychrotolerans]|uniref:Uncharacterized protein n=1 Tax=Deinococcus psychrotolerans TaxID=2489213 RepID=A0A3G8YKC1_9DEIO|nr:hypothetical protein [Deinococcus psychrotolerans]AZI42984.1 hypothetical protein EHF33_09725 [Deinococcus psychrotolerans]